MSKYYAVKFGRKTGVFLSWDEAKKYTDKFPASLPSKPNFKSFSNECEATKFLDVENIKYNKQLLLNKLESCNFEGFIHITEFKNALSILHSGFLYSRNKAKELKFVDRANKEIIEKTRDVVLECVRFYYKQKTPTYNAARYKQPVMFIFNKNLIFHQSVLFSNGNAKSKESKKTPDPLDALNFDWEIILKRGAYSSNGMTASKEKILRNAEFLVIDQVPLEFIFKIVVKDNDTKEKLLQVEPELKSIIFIDGEYF